ncbi:hypothetical protein GCM10027290_22960 [Micromonospora sonneratiae]
MESASVPRERRSLVTGSETPPIPAGTRLHLRSEDWYHPTGVGDTYQRDIVVSVAHTGTATATDASVWIVGHELDCTRAHVEDHPPCVELRVKRDAIRRACQAGPQP